MVILSPLEAPRWSSLPSIYTHVSVDASDLMTYTDSELVCVTNSVWQKLSLGHPRLSHKQQCGFYFTLSIPLPEEFSCWVEDSQGAWGEACVRKHWGLPQGHLARRVINLTNNSCSIEAEDNCSTGQHLELQPQERSEPEPPNEVTCEFLIHRDNVRE